MNNVREEEINKGREGERRKGITLKRRQEVMEGKKRRKVGERNNVK